jgi:Na+/H+-dicarboxylate symporter
LLWIILVGVGYLILRNRIPQLFKRISQPLLIAFSTTSSEAVFPKLTEELERFGCKDKIVSFVLPLGYSFNLDGSMMYMTFASLTIAQAYGVHIDLGTQLVMLLVLMLTSKGVAGVPRASLIVVIATCAMFKIPPEGIALILPIDHFCDMFRTATNVVGNSIATAVVSKWEGALANEHIKYIIIKKTKQPNVFIRCFSLDRFIATAVLCRNGGLWVLLLWYLQKQVCLWFLFTWRFIVIRRRYLCS